MKKHMGANIVIAALSILSITLTVILINNDDNSLLEPFVLNTNSNVSVKSIKAYQDNGIIYQEFRMSGDATCEDIMVSLDIHPLTIKNKIYTPTCVPISKTRIKIAYTTGKIT